MLKIRIETKNDAFKEDLEGELGRCLKDVDYWIGNGTREHKIWDKNGNKVGYFRLTNR